LFSSPSGTEMFHFPEFAPPRLCIQRGVRRHYAPWVSPFGHPRIIAWLAAPRGFSQPPTSFFASDCLGIHRVPFVAWSLPPLFVFRLEIRVATLFYSFRSLILSLVNELERPAYLTAATLRLFVRLWWSRSGSNRRHPACKAGALPAELRPLNLPRSVGGPGKI
jgi:hypothetical protein